MKPENILVCKSGVVKICDFGFARMLSELIVNVFFVHMSVFEMNSGLANGQVQITNTRDDYNGLTSDIFQTILLNV